MANIAPSKISDPATGSGARRSTRIAHAMPLTVSGVDKVGMKFSERTHTVSLNCHGCCFLSRYDYWPGSWVSLEVPNQQVNGNGRPVRARVRFIRLPGSPQEVNQVAVELETPANVWGVTPPPHDWIRFPGSLAAAAQPALALAPAPEPPMIPPSTEKTRILPTPSKAEASETTSRGSAAPGSRASTSPPGPTKPTRVVVSGEQLLRALEGKLQQVAENAVTSAVTKAVQTIENACRASLHQIEERWVQHRERLVASAREELLGQLRAELARAGEQQNQFAARLHETADRVAAEFTDETVRLSDRQLARLGEKVQAATGEAAAQLEAQAAEACSQLETAAGTALAGFHVQASVEIELAVTEARKNVESALASFVAEKRADWQARQRAWHDELARVSKQETEQFRRHLETILNSWMSAAVSAVNEQSKALLDSLAKRTAQQLREPSRG